MNCPACNAVVFQATDDQETFLIEDKKAYHIITPLQNGVVSKVMLDDASRVRHICGSGRG
ncbi:MAG: hypothetical protein HY548_07170 [Elusimicrobia bacterium]|nr:hypothetical protein [Elusimicrobiota bacterium]